MTTANKSNPNMAIIHHKLYMRMIYSLDKNKKK